MDTDLRAQLRIDSSSLKFIFGVKLRHFHQEKCWRLKKLSAVTDLSQSYLNEIEKGRKYPKAEKIMLIGEGMGVDHDELVSITMGERMDQMLQLFSSPTLHDFPYELFGISLEDVMELFKASPGQATALATTLLEDFHAYDMDVEIFFLTSLRAYQEQQDIYFPEIEEAAENLRCELKWSPE